MRLSGVSSRLGDPEPFFPEGPALSERAQLGMARGEPGTGEHGGQEDLTQALVAPRPLEGRHGLPEAFDRPTIVPLGLVGSTEVAVRQCVQVDIAAGCGECEGALGGGDGLVMRAHEVEMGGQKARDLSQPTRVVEGLGEGLGLVQVCQDPPRVAKRAERRAQGEPEIDPMLDGVALLW